MHDLARPAGLLTITCSQSYPQLLWAMSYKTQSCKHSLANCVTRRCCNFC